MSESINNILRRANKNIEGGPASPEGGSSSAPDPTDHPKFPQGVAHNHPTREEQEELRKTIAQARKDAEQSIKDSPFESYDEYGTARQHTREYGDIRKNLESSPAWNQVDKGPQLQEITEKIFNKIEINKDDLSEEALFGTPQSESKPSINLDDLSEDALFGTPTSTKNGTDINKADLDEDALFSNKEKSFAQQSKINLDDLSEDALFGTTDDTKP